MASISAYAPSLLSTFDGRVLTLPTRSLDSAAYKAKQPTIKSVAARDGNVRQKLHLVDADRARCSLNSGILFGRPIRASVATYVLNPIEEILPYIIGFSGVIYRCNTGRIVEAIFQPSVAGYVNWRFQI